MKICAPFLLFIEKIFVPLAQEINLKTSIGTETKPMLGHKNISKHVTTTL